jgi:cytochrome P450
VLVPSLVFSGTDTVARALRDAAWLAATYPIYRCTMPEGIERLPAALVQVLDRIVSAEGA